MLTPWDCLWAIYGEDASGISWSRQRPIFGFAFGSRHSRWSAKLEWLKTLTTANLRHVFRRGGNSVRRWQTRKGITARRRKRLLS